VSLQPLTPVDLRFLEAETPQIQIESWSNSARKLLIRGFTRDGTISFDHTTNTDRSRKAEGFDIPDLPIMVQVAPETAPVRRGECYIRLTLLMGGFAVGRLSAAYLTDSKTITWPPGVFEGFTEGPGLIRYLTGTDPAAGNEVSETVPTNARWRIKFLWFSLVTDATVTTRRVTLLIDDGSTIFFASRVAPGQAESLTRYYLYVPGYAIEETAFDANLRIREALPDPLILPQGYRIRTSTTNLQAGDNWGTPVLVVEEWIEE